MEIKLNNFPMSGDPTSPVPNSYPCPRSPSFNVEDSETNHFKLFNLISIGATSAALATLKKGKRGLCWILTRELGPGKHVRSSGKEGERGGKGERERQEREDIEEREERTNINAGRRRSPRAWLCRQTTNSTHIERDRKWKSNWIKNTFSREIFPL